LRTIPLKSHLSSVLICSEMKPIFGSSLIRWQPTRGHLVAVLSVGFIALGSYLENRDRLSMHLAIGIGIGLGIAQLIYDPPRWRRRLQRPSGNPSVLKTIMFWGILAVLVVLVYQLIRGPVH
jgi:hypothetical protein